MVRRFKVSTDRSTFLLGQRTPGLRKSDGRGRMMRVTESERKSIARQRELKNRKLLRKFRRGPSGINPLA